MTTQGEEIASQAADGITDAFAALGEELRQDTGDELVALTPPNDPMARRSAFPGCSAGGFLRSFGHHLTRDDESFGGEHSRAWLADRLARATVSGEVETLATTLGHEVEPWTSLHGALTLLQDHRADVIEWATRDPRRTS
ncbi:MAG TPA: hypothetical protein VKA66_21440 [Mycobacterium sp.]|nr:hypothetical protein [Mycobacterium sp.]